MGQKTTSESHFGAGLGQGGGTQVGRGRGVPRKSVEGGLIVELSVGVDRMETLVSCLTTGRLQTTAAFADSIRGKTCGFLVRRRSPSDPV